jgi:hypothetical protein
VPDPDAYLAPAPRDLEDRDGPATDHDLLLSRRVNSKLAELVVSDGVDEIGPD